MGRSLEDIAKLDFTTVIGGHGPNLTRQAYLGYRDRVIAIRERVRALNRDRKTAEEIAATLTQEFNRGHVSGRREHPGDDDRAPIARAAASFD